ncbi:MAG: hypothetical protein HY226_01170 [Candidatus Vogelbacteria bacterium]|nr:hypothetical protein [Candidatus Vogelbacteria bacterium]
MNGDTEDWLTVRLSPGDSGPDSIDALVLLKDWDGSYKDKWVKRLLEVELPTGLYKVHDPEDQRKILKTFNRPVPGLTDPYNVTVREVKTGSNDISSYNSQYWDFVRNLSEEEGGGQEFYFVEADIDWENDTNSTRLMRAYVAQPITLSSIELIKTADLLDAQKA